MFRPGHKYKDEMEAVFAKVRRGDVSDAREYMFSERVRGNPHGDRKVLAGVMDEWLKRTGWPV